LVAQSQTTGMKGHQEDI